MAAEKEREAKQKRTIDMHRRKNPFDKSDRIKLAYERDLRKVAREVGRIIEAFQVKSSLGDISKMQNHLAEYAKILAPWAQLKGTELAEAANQQDKLAWARATAEMGRGIHLELRGNTRIGSTMREIMNRQVHYITSLPIEAGERVHQLVIEGLSNSTRAEEIAKEIARSGEVTQSRAMLIARTETSRAQTSLTQARSLAVGAESYIWRSVHDSRVRLRHRELDKSIHRWDNPPVASEPNAEVIHAHPGEIFNCRCWAQPIIAD